MKLLLPLVCLLFGMSICAHAHLGIEEGGDDDYSDGYEVDTIQEEADEGDDDYDGDGDEDDDDDDDDDDATSLRFRQRGRISSGDIVTIRVVKNKRLHVGCYSGKCGADPCAGRRFNPWDYKRCSGEVFRIYRAAGSGDVRVGDEVGFFYPLKRQWMSASGAQQLKLNPCPGVPRGSGHRLNTGCWGEVFKIYARRKRIGQPIYQSDSVMIYYPRSKAFLKYRYNYGRRDGLVRSFCPGRKGPPRRNAYYRCFKYMFQIHTK